MSEVACTGSRSFYDRETGRLECDTCPGDCEQAWRAFGQNPQDDSEMRAERVKSRGSCDGCP